MKKVKILFLVLAMFAFSACAEKEVIKTDDPLYPVYKERMALIQEMKKFEEKLGFRPTNNFLNYSNITGYPGCFVALKLKLIYSYEDRSFNSWINLSKEECLALNNEKTEAFFYEAEAVAGVGTPVSRSLLKAPIERFLFVVLHEDFHEQLDLPLGVEEAVGSIFALEAAKIFAQKKFGKDSKEYSATKKYAEFLYAFAKEVNQAYAELEIVYRKKVFMPSGEFELKRAQIIERLNSQRKNLVKEFDIQKKLDSQLNGAYIGFIMTYVRHFASMQDVFSKLDNNLKNFFGLLKMADSTKPSRSMVEERIGNYPDEYFAEQYEKIVIKEIEKWLEEVKAKK